MSIENEEIIEQDFFEEMTNEFGHPQMYQICDGARFPVCSSCHAMVMPNRGQGSACDSCQHEAYIWAAMDHDEGEI